MIFFLRLFGWALPWLGLSSAIVACDETTPLAHGVVGGNNIGARLGGGRPLRGAEQGKIFAGNFDRRAANNVVAAKEKKK